MDEDWAEALARVTLDVEPDPELVAWAADQLLAGHGLADVVAELTARGWSAADAEAAVEEARVRTRRERGVVTRDDVAGTIESRHRRQTSGMATFYRSGGGPLGIVAFAMGLRQSVAAARHLGRIARRHRRG